MVEKADAQSRKVRSKQKSTSSREKRYEKTRGDEMPIKDISTSNKATRFARTGYSIPNVSGVSSNSKEVAAVEDVTRDDEEQLHKKDWSSVHKHNVHRSTARTMTPEAMKSLIAFQIEESFAKSSTVSNQFEVLLVAPVKKRADSAAQSGHPCAVAISLEEQVHPSGSIKRVGRFHEVSIGQSSEDGANEMVVNLHETWLISKLTLADWSKSDNTQFHIFFDAAVGEIEPLVWKTQSVSLCKEILWIVLTLYRILLPDEELPEHLIGSVRELDVTANYEGFSLKHKRLYNLMRMISEEAMMESQRVDRPGPSNRRRLSTVDPGSNSDHHEKGEAVLQRLGWKELGRDGLQLALTKELEELEGSTIPQLIAWSEASEYAHELVAVLDDIEAQLVVMEGWLEAHGRPLEVLKRDMAPIECKNNALDMQWRNYQNLQDYVSTIVDAVSLPPEDESILNEFKLKMNEKALEQEEVANQIFSAADSLLTALHWCGRLSSSPATHNLKLVSDANVHLRAIANSFLVALTSSLKKTLKKLAVDAVDNSIGSNAGSIAGDGTSQKLIQAQRQFHSNLKKYELLFSQVGALEITLGSIEANQSSPCSVALQKAYVEEFGGTLLRKFNAKYFLELLSRVQFSKSIPSSLASLDRAVIGAEPNNLTIKPSSDKVTVADAVLESIEYAMPVVARTNKFFLGFFSIGSARSELEKASAILEEGLSDLRARYSRLGMEIIDVSDILGALTVLDEASRRSDCQNQIAAHVIIEFKASLTEKFNRFIEEQVSWVQNWRTDAKRPGILVPFLKLPRLIDRMQVSTKKSKKVSDTQEASTAFLKLALVLFQLLEQMAQANQKYADVIKMENAYFFRHTIGARNITVFEDYVNKASQIFQGSSQAYMDWLLQCQFPNIITFFSRIEELILSVGPQDVRYHQNRSSLDDLIRKHLNEKVVPEGLKLIHSRMEKHLCKESCLLPVLWDHLSDMMYALFSRYEELCNVCYSFKLPLSASQVKRVATVIGGDTSRGLARIISEGAMDTTESRTSPRYSPHSGGRSSLPLQRKSLHRGQLSSINGWVAAGASLSNSKLD